MLLCRCQKTPGLMCKLIMHLDLECGQGEEDSTAARLLLVRGDGRELKMGPLPSSLEHEKYQESKLSIIIFLKKLFGFALNESDGQIKSSLRNEMTDSDEENESPSNGIIKEILVADDVPCNENVHRHCHCRCSS